MTASPAAPPPGLTVNGYTLITRIGEGGMGVVHLARRGDGPRVALKVLRPHIVGDDEIRARLAREVNSLSRIRSPRVAEIVDADPWGAIPYVATRYVPGLPLHDHVAEEGPIAGRDLVHLAGTLAEGLAAVHACGVLHRDVKPANVLMEGRSPVLIDFGLARVADDPKLTGTGWLLGTPGYLAPEILYGEEASRASDVHSWAATVAYAGLGRPPFGRGPGMAIMDRVRRGEHDLTGLSPDLTGLVAAALDPDPRRRPTLPEVRAELASGAWTEAPVPPTPAPMTPDRFTMPMAARSPGPLREAGPGWEDGAQETATREQRDDRWADDIWTDDIWTDAERVEEAGTAESWPGPAGIEERRVVQPDGPRPDPYRRTPAPHPPPGWGPDSPDTAPRPPLVLRARRAALFGGSALAGGALVAAYPATGSALLVLAAWLLRSGSLAGTAAENRRLLRGPRWYDPVQTLLGAPWRLVAAIPGTLVLGLWSLGIACAGGLLGYAAAAGTPTVLGIAGVLFAVSIGLGPGGPRVRGPMDRVVRPLAANPLVWFVALVAVLVLAGIWGSLAQTGPDWAPFEHGPFHLLD